MEVNYVLVFLATIVQFILGALWYSPVMFGKWWMEIMECTNLPAEELKKMQKAMAPFYALQLLLTLITTVSFANLLPHLIGSFGVYHIAFWIWVGFIAPVQVACVVWANTKKQYWAKQIFIMLSYQLISIMLVAFILSL
jgi:hypothetical protein